MHFAGICGLKTELNYPFKYFVVIVRHVNQLFQATDARKAPNHTKLILTTFWNRP